MKCPSCGKELQKNKLFCENCGAEICVVPDFETEVENNMETHLEGLKIAVSDEILQQEKPVKAGAGRGLLLACVLCFFAAGIIAFLLVWHPKPDWNAEVYVNHAREELSKGNTLLAQEYFEEAISLDFERTDAQLELAEIYFSLNKKDKYEAILLELLDNPNLMENELTACIGKLIAYYHSNGENDKIRNLFQKYNSQEILDQYADYYAPAPVFSVEPGYYTKVMPIHLEAPRNGTIYFTTDGTNPTDKSEKYSMPIILDEGENLIKAVYISKGNISSEIVSGAFHITMSKPESPVVRTVSGDYFQPTKIEVEIEDADIFYTMDGSVPDEASNVYIEPFDMPVGQSQFRFVAIKNHVSSDVVDRSFNLNLPCNFDEVKARELLLNSLIKNGYILNEYGDNPDYSINYRYTYLTYCFIREKMYYVFDESSSADNYSSVHTTYGVDALDGTVVKLMKENNISYTYAEINNP